MDVAHRSGTSIELARRAEDQRGLGKREEARIAAEASLAIEDETSGDGWAIALRCLGTLEWARGNLSAARERYDRALSVRRAQRPLSSTGLVAALDDLGVACYFLGMNSRALRLRQEALEIASGWEGPDTAVHRRLRRRLAQSHQAEGAVDLARSLYLECRPLDEDSLDDKLGWYNAMALLAEDTGEIAEAAEWFETLIDIMEGEEASVGLAQALGNAVLARLELGSFDETAHLLRKLRNLCRTDGKLSSRLALLDARIHFLQERRRYAAACKVARQAEQLVREALGEDGPDLMRILLCALLMRAAGDHAGARDLLERHAPEEAGEGVDCVPLVVELASLRLSTGQPQGALLLLRRALTAQIGQPDPEQKWVLFSTLAEAAHALGRKRTGALLAKMALVHLGGSARGLSEVQYRTWLQPRMATYDLLLNRLTMAGRVPEAIALQVRRSQEIARGLASCRRSFDDKIAEIPFRAGEKAFVERYQALERTMRARIEQGEYGPPPAEVVALAGAWLDEMLQEGFDLDLTLPPVAVPLRVEGPHPVLRFLPYGDGLRGVLTVQQRDFSFSVDSSAAAVASQTRAMWDSLRNGTGEWMQPSRALHDALIAPAEQLAGGAPRLDVVASGMMAYVPFAALHDGSSFLVERIAIALRTGQDRPHRWRSLAPRWNSVAFASVEHSALPRAGPEAVLVASKTGGTAFVDKDFTERKLEETLSEGVSLLHIATHFDYAPGRPHHSALLLGDGTRLRLSRIAGSAYDLSGVDLVVLSACETGISDTLDLGLEGLAGLFQAKGARHVVATLWRVDDEATEALMERFYAEFRPGAAFDPVDALARAQRAMLRDFAAETGGKPSRHGIGAPAASGRPGFASPAAWAGFAAFDRVG